MGPLGIYFSGVRLKAWNYGYFSNTRVFKRSAYQSRGNVCVLDGEDALVERRHG